MRIFYLEVCGHALRDSLLAHAPCVKCSHYERIGLEGNRYYTSESFIEIRVRLLSQIW